MRVGHSMSEKSNETQHLDTQPPFGQAEPHEPESVPLPPGAQLAAKRLELSITVEEIANRLNLAPRQILAIEADNYSALPGMPITRGFIRSYAKLLGLEPLPLLEMLPNETGLSKDDSSIRRALPAKPFYDSRSSFTGKRNGARKIGMVVAGSAILAVIMVGWALDWFPESFFSALKAQVPSFTSAENNDKISGEASQADVPVHAERNSDTSVSAPAATAAKLDGADLAVRSSNEAGSAPVKESSPAASMPVKEEATKPAAFPGNEVQQSQNKDTLVLKVNEESWIEVRDSSRKVLVSRLAKPGETETLAVLMPLDLKIGNAAGVEVILRGAPVQLKPAAQGNVARLTLK